MKLLSFLLVCFCCVGLVLAAKASSSTEAAFIIADPSTSETQPLDTSSDAGDSYDSLFVIVVLLLIIAYLLYKKSQRNHFPSRSKRSSRSRKKK